MKYNRPHATAAWGTMAKDWEAGIDYPRMVRERFRRAQDSVKAAGLGAVLCFNVDNVRYVTGTHIGEWARDKMTRFSLLTRGGEPHLWDFGSAAKHHRLSCPWLPPENVRGGMIGLRGAVAPSAGLFTNAAKEIKALIGASVGRVEDGARLVGQAGQTMQEIVPGLRKKVIIDGAGHWIQQERADEVNTALVAFLKATRA